MTQQVKYFLPDDSPSQIGRKSQGGHHHLQAKTTSILRSSTNESTDSDLPPGFESGPFLDQTMVKWECPPQASNYYFHIMHSLANWFL